MRRANTRDSLKIVSYWGDCSILTLQGGNRIEIIRPDGRSITPETNAEKSNQPVTEKFEQAKLFSANDDGRFSKYVDPDVSVPTDFWTES